MRSHKLQHSTPTERKTTPSQEGFTLIELMVVVIIVAVLATVAVVAYTRHLKSGRVLEARAFIAAIQGRQELYFQQFGSYCDASGTSYHPALVTGEPTEKTWNPTAASQPGWSALGTKPEKGTSYFEYRVTASAAPHTVSGGTNEATFGIPTGRPWFYIVGRGNLDGRGTCGDPPGGDNCTLLWTTSARNDIVVRNEGQ